MKAPNTDGVH